MTSANNQMPKTLTRPDLFRLFWRSSFEQGSWNYERMQNLGFVYVMMPAIKRLYDTPEDQRTAVLRHLGFFNTMPYMQSTITGVVANMEVQRANGSQLDDQAINNVKVGMMGPLAGVGDPIWWGTFRPVLAAFAAGLAQGKASLIGPLLFFFGWNIARLTFRWQSQKIGYSLGVDITTKTGHLLPKLTQGASILGMFVMGAVIPRWTSIEMPTVIARVHAHGQLEQLTLQNVCDRILPGLVPVLLTLICLWLIRKRINPIWLMLGILVLSILGYSIGLLGVK